MPLSRRTRESISPIRLQASYWRGDDKTPGSSCSFSTLPVTK